MANGRGAVGCPPIGGGVSTRHPPRLHLPTHPSTACKEGPALSSSIHQHGRDSRDHHVSSSSSNLFLTNLSPCSPAAEVPVAEVPVAEATAEAEAVPETTNGATEEVAKEAESEATNGEAKEATNGEAKEATTSEAKEVTNGNTEETNGAAEATEEAPEATKRKADSPSEETEDVSAEKIAKLKEVATEKLNEAEEKLPAEPLTEAEAVA